MSQYQENQNGLGPEDYMAFFIAIVIVGLLLTRILIEVANG